MQSIKLGIVFFLVQATLSSAVKEGSCPKAPAYGACVITCGADEDCDGDHKCCSNGCGAWCSEPMCPLGQERVSCPPQLCNYAGCPGKPRDSLKCVIQSCGQCGVKFINTTTGQDVDCGPDETMCSRMLAASPKKPLLGQYKPECDENGHFKKIQCHEAYCFCVNAKGIPDLSTKVMNGKTPNCPETSLCQRKKLEAQKLPAIGRYMPQCKLNGDFEEVQCHASTGQCWCVDKNGREWTGTRQRGGKLDCKTSVCPKGVKMLQCDPLLCSAAKCPSQNNVVCRVNPCGKCEVEFLDKFNRKVHCFSKCQQQRMTALGISDPSEKPTKPLVGRYVPQCSADGKYQEVQCYGSTGYCWCVDEEGNPVTGTMTRGTPHCNKKALGVCSGKIMFTCLRNFCQWASCPAQPDATCRVNSCGGCKVEFVDKSGNVVDCNKGLTKCQLESSKAKASGGFGLQPVGRFVPSCDVNGDYESIQCWASTGYCWCVDDKGVEVEGTRIRGRPDCSLKPTVKPVKDGFCPTTKLTSGKRCSSDGDCEKNKKCCGGSCQDAIFTACPNGRPFLLCLHMCQFAKCAADPTATCFSDPCKMCAVEFHDKNGNVVDCHKDLTLCQAKQKAAHGLLGEFKPKCASDGGYEKTQCHEGYCWCVNQNGRELNGTRVRKSQKPVCDAKKQSDFLALSLCELQRLHSLGKSDKPLIGQFVPQCNIDGSFKEIQCHASTGYCWCVDIAGQELPKSRMRGQPDCSKACKPVMCRMYCEFGWAQDANGCDICKCADAPSKPGYCPSVPGGSVGTCAEQCRVDDDCVGNSKCCSNGCGHVCTAPEYKEKPGHCPAVNISAVGTCVSKCGSDVDCTGDQKCCSNGCGRVCRSPARQACPRNKPLVMCIRNPCDGATCLSNPKAKCRADYCGACSAQHFDDRNNRVNCTADLTKCQQEYLDATRKPLLGVFVVRCQADGSYAPVQCHASTGFCWCVTRDGKEIKNTSIRGTPKCEPAPVKKGPVCAFNKRWSLRSEDPCKKTTCSLNSHAKCVAPQGGCTAEDRKAKFYDYNNKEVQCLTECLQKRVDATNPPRVGAFVPSCNEDGSYARKQCWGSVGQCWCVSRDGTEWPGTRTRGDLNCDDKVPEVLKMHVLLTLQYNFSLVKDAINDFKSSAKAQLVTILGLKTEQISDLQVYEGSIVVDFYAENVKGGKDVSTLPGDISTQISQQNLVLHFGGSTFIVESVGVVASPQFQEDEPESENGGLSKTGVALIAVFSVVLAIVLAAVAYKVVQTKRGRRSDEATIYQHSHGTTDSSVCLTQAQA